MAAGEIRVTLPDGTVKVFASVREWRWWSERERARRDAAIEDAKRPPSAPGGFWAGLDAKIAARDGGKPPARRTRIVGGPAPPVRPLRRDDDVSMSASIKKQFKTLARKRKQTKEDDDE